MISGEIEYCHPFQKLCALDVHSFLDLPNEAKLLDSDFIRLLLAAAGPYIFIIDLSTGQVLDQWPSHNRAKVVSQTNGESQERGEDIGRPSKRRKTDNNRRDNTSSDSSDSVEIVAQRQKGQRKRPKIAIEKLPNVSHLVTTPDKKHVVAVTAEDKSIRIFELVKGVKLSLLSKRYMSIHIVPPNLRH